MEANLFGQKLPEKKHRALAPAGKKRKKLTKADREFERRAEWMAGQTPPATKSETAFRHSHWDTRRKRITEILCSCGTRAAAMDRWTNCGADAIVQWSETAQKHRIRASFCKSRHCEPCARARGNLVAGNLMTKLQERADRKFRFVTLTLKHSLDPLKKQIDRLYKSFKQMREGKWWKGKVKGGAFTLECKYNLEKQRWHPHLHIICDANWLDQKSIAAHWYKATGDSFIVDVRLLNSAKDAAYYLSKYVAKGTSASVWDSNDTAQEWITASKGVRICATFGTWRGISLTKPTRLITDWVPVCKLEALIRRVSEGEVHAGILMLLLRPPGASDSS